MNIFKNIKPNTKHLIALLIASFIPLTQAAVKLKINDSSLMNLAGDVVYHAELSPKIIKAQVSNPIVCTGPDLFDRNIPLSPILLEIRNANGEIAYQDAYGVASAQYKVGNNNNSFNFEISTNADVSCAIGNETFPSQDLIFQNGFTQVKQGDLRVSIVDTTTNHYPIPSSFGNSQTNNQVSVGQTFSYIIKVENSFSGSPLVAKIRDSYPTSLSNLMFEQRSWSCQVAAVALNSNFSIGQSCGSGTGSVSIDNIEIAFGDILFITTTQKVGPSTGTTGTISTIASVFINDANGEDTNLGNNARTTSFNVTLNNPPVISNLTSSISLLEDLPSNGNNYYNIAFNLADSDGDNLTVSASSSDNSIVDIVSTTNSQIKIHLTPNQFGNVTVTLSVSDGKTVVSRTIDVEVIAVNDPPLFSLNNTSITHDLSSLTNAVIIEPSFFANISMGPNEDNLGQNIQNLVVQSGDAYYNQNSDLNIFSVYPYFDINKNLHYTINTNYASGGKAYLKVRMEDDGGTANNGFNASAQYFTIEVLPQTWALKATVSGLNLGNTLQIKSANTLQNMIITDNGTYSFPDLVEGSIYIIVVKKQPQRSGSPASATNQTCLMSNQTTIQQGTITADVNATITCTTNQYQVTGKVYGLDMQFNGTGSELILQNNGSNDIIIDGNSNYNSNGGYYEFAFPAQDDGSGYAVTITNPSFPQQTCNVSYGAGYIPGADVTKVRVDCSIDTFSVGGSIAGLLNSQDVALKNNNTNGIFVSNGNFIFSTEINDQGSYEVTIETFPSNPAQTCQFQNPDNSQTLGNNGFQGATNTSISGIINGADVTNLDIICQ